jgi:hypothetical protein
MRLCQMRGLFYIKIYLLAELYVVYKATLL